MINKGLRIAALLAMINLVVVNLSFASSITLAQAATGSSGETPTTEKPRLVDLWQPGDPGQRMNIRGRIGSIDGTPLADVPISIRQADGNGDYSDAYSVTILSDKKGRYQFASVLPGNYIGVRHVHISVNLDGYQYYQSQILFKDDPNMTGDIDQDRAIFLEESTVAGETRLFGRFDIQLVPE